MRGSCAEYLLKFAVNDPRRSDITVANYEARQTTYRRANEQNCGRGYANPDRCIGVNLTGGWIEGSMREMGREGTQTGPCIRRGRNAREPAAKQVMPQLPASSSSSYVGSGIPHSSWTTSRPGSMVSRLGQKKQRTRKRRRALDRSPCETRALNYALARRRIEETSL